MCTLSLEDLQRDLHDAAAMPAKTHLESINLLDAVRKATCGPDDGSNAGPWIECRATTIDGDDKRVRREAVK